MPVIILILAGCTHSKPSTPEIVATWRGGVLTADDLEVWAPEGRHEDGPTDRRRICEDMALVSTLADEAIAAGVEPDLRNTIDESIDTILTNALRKHLASTIVVSETEIDRPFKQHPDAFHTPQKSRLRNLFLAFPPNAGETEKAEVRRRLDDLRRRLSQGEDFGKLAAAESDSQTRFRKGIMGNFAPGQLPPAVEAIAMALEPGEISEPIETAEGLTLLKCDQIIPARNPSQEEVRSKLEANLRRIEERRRWEALVRSLGGDPDGAFLHATAERARELGLDRDPRTIFRIRWTRRRHLAAEALKRRIEAVMTEPTEAEVRQFFDENPEHFVAPETFELSVIRLPVSTENPAAVHRLAFELAHDVQAGRRDFVEAARAISDDASAPDGGRLAPMTRRQLAGRGPEFMKTVTALEPGEVGREFLAGDSWWIVRFDRHNPQTPLPFEETASEALDALMEVRAAVIQKTIEAEIRGHLEVIVIG